MAAGDASAGRDQLSLLGAAHHEEEAPELALAGAGSRPADGIDPAGGRIIWVDGGVMWQVNASYARGAGQPVAFDRNLRDAPAFLNEDEGSRAVFVSPAAIDPATGAASLVASRRYTDLGTVRKVTAAGRWTGWSPSLNVHARVQLGPWVREAPQKRVTVWVAARNVTAGLDYLLHGPDDLRGWGQLTAVDNTLLYVRGFDPGTNQFRYQVNPRFGTPVGGGLLGRVPFALRIQARVALGNDRVVSQFIREMNANGNQDLAPERIRQFLRQQLPNVPSEVIVLNAPRRLYLTPSQVAQLQSAGDSLESERTRFLNEIVETVTGARRFSSQSIARVRELKLRAVALRQAGADAARAVLTAEQWNQLPATLSSPGVEFATYPPQVITSGSPY